MFLVLLQVKTRLPSSAYPGLTFALFLHYTRCSFPQFICCSFVIYNASNYEFSFKKRLPFSACVQRFGGFPRARGNAYLEEKHSQKAHEEGCPCCCEEGREEGTQGSKQEQLNSKKALLKLPKGPASPFALFVSETSEAVMSKQQGAGSIAEITRVASQNWKALGESDKQSKYEGLRANHEETLRQWWATADRSLVELENKRRRRHNKNVAGGAKGTKYQLLKDPFAPKRPGSAYLAFYKEKLAALGSISRDELLSQSKITASQWKSLSDAEKAPYVQQAAAEAEKYKQDMAQYNASRAA
ncbi:hypothetical protein GQ54DRAFT_69882 [Martensiomyces pterosporus]|nr:hypothetical protein GQ54DRAFT_69882 [Martensiomyces pterosporus]